MEEAAKKSASKIKKILAGLAIAYGVRWATIMGIGMYHEQMLKHSPVWNNYQQEVVEIRKRKDDNLRELYRLNKSRDCLEQARAYSDNHHLDNKIVTSEFEQHYKKEKHRLGLELSKYGQERDEARKRLLSNPDAQKHTNPMDTCISRAFVPFLKPQGDYFSVFGFEE